MRFPHIQYKERNNSHNIPIDKWCNMVNDSREYCVKFSNLKWLEYRFWKLVRRFNVVELPSFHPYWKKRVLEVDKTNLNRQIETYNICVKDPDQIKVHYNSSTNLIDIENRIEALRKRIENNYL